MHNRKVQIGTVVSNKMDSSIVVKVETLIKHPLYKKYIKKSKKYMAHDAENQCNIGDKVEIVETRPLSKRKNWRLKKIIERAPEL
jgi:small subunit ribosomal protein S17